MREAVVPVALALALCVSWLSLPGTGQAQVPQGKEPAQSAESEATPGPDAAARKEASERFQRGVDLFHEEAFRAALVEFERAYELAPNYLVLYNIGQVKLQLGDYLGATQSYERYLVDGGTKVRADRRKEVERDLAILRDRVGRISVTCNVDNAEVFIDDLPAGVTPIAATVAVNIGRHRVHARSASGASDTRVVDVAGGDVVEVDLKLAQVLADTPMSKRKKIAIGSWAAGGALVGLAVAGGLVAQAKVDERDTLLDEPLVSAAEAQSLTDDAQRWALTTDIAGVLALAAVSAGVWLWLTDEDPEQEAGGSGPSVALGAAPNQLSLRGTF